VSAIADLTRYQVGASEQADRTPLRLHGRESHVSSPSQRLNSPSKPRSPRRTYAPPGPARSRTMTAVRGTGNKTTELALLHLMRTSGIVGWRRGLQIEGKPDFCFRRERVAVFVDGCFWHGCPTCYRSPRTNSSFWRAKITYNASHDSEVSNALRNAGWKVLRVWEHQLRRTPARVIIRLRRLLAETQLPRKMPKARGPHSQSGHP
jgi:DNA mismatch endonuclease, patch repair protein